MINRQVDMVTTEDFARVAKECCPDVLIDFVSEVMQIREGWKSDGTDILTAPMTKSCHVFRRQEGTA